ncbi:MAG: tRNA pseudouridine(13) synthase TruD [Phycisphaerae bacterium]|nr:tRNA pseudouridine(13) synthase TruD [Phycisphaerae bacterium]
MAYQTEDTAGIGGVLKQRPEDFVVTEMPLFEPSGRGDHLYLLIEKQRRLTTDVTRLLSRHFCVARRDVGYAGLKDKHAITRQWFSIEHAKEDRAAAFDEPQIGILDIDRHETKLKRGNLAGNRFQIRVRDVEPSGVITAKAVLDHLVEYGAVNFLGPQRFGYRRDNHLQGKNLLHGDLQSFLDRLLGEPQDNEPEVNTEARLAYEAGDYARAVKTWPTVNRFERQAVGPLSRGASLEHAVNGVDKSQRLLMISAFQSAIFNQLLNQRLLAGRLGRLEVGDLAFKHDTRGCFEVIDPDTEQPRCDRLEISPTGPMWGRKMTRASGAVGTAEAEALAESGVSEADLKEGRYTPDGARRAFRMIITNPQVRAGADDHGPFIEVCFELPRGSYATTVMREIMKNEP